MLQMVTRLQKLLAKQLQTSCGSISRMSDVEWLEYEDRNTEIAALIEALQTRKSVVQ